MIYASVTDLDEAYQVGRKAVEIAAAGETGYMATMLRQPGDTYRVQYAQVPLEQVANSERHFPANWIAANRVDVTDDFLRYAQPLIGTAWPAIPLEHGLQRYARFEPIFADSKLPAYVPQNYRSKGEKS
jgi:6-phosphofructokinase 1